MQAFIISRKLAAAHRTAALSKAVLVTGVALALPAVAADSAAALASSGDASSANPAKLDKIEVRATGAYKADRSASVKFTQPLVDTPQTIQVIGSDLFNQQGATNLTEALRNSAGVGTFYAGENGSTSTGDAIYLRGFDTSNSIFVDGVRDAGSVSRDVFNIEQIEVQKGPASTDTGRSAPTGSVNLISKQAYLGAGVSAGATYGSAEQRRSVADWNQALGESSALRLNAMWQDSGVHGRDHVRNARWGFAPSLGFGLDGATRVHVNLLYVKQDNVPDGFVPTIGLPGWTPQPGLEQLVGHAVNPENFYGTRADHDNSTSAMATLRVEHDFSDTLKLSNIARWGRTDQDYLLTSFMVTGGTTSNPLAGRVTWTDIDDLSTYRLARSNPTFKDQGNGIVTDQLNLRADFAMGRVQHFVSTGLELTREKQDSAGQAATNRSAWSPASLYEPNWNATGLTWAHNGVNAHGRTDTLAAYAFDTLKFGENFLLTAGVRADRYATDFNSTVLCGSRNAPACGSLPPGTIVPGVDARVEGTLLNWKLGGVYKVTSALSLYANSAVSQQPPGGANFTLSAAANSLDNPNLDPQQARTLEVGMKWNALDDALALNAAVFRTVVGNEINTQVLDDSGNPTQTGEKKVSGLELSAVGNLTQAWSISAGFSHLATRVVEGAPTAQDGTPNLTYTPDKAFTAWTTYRLPFGLTVGGGARYVAGLHRGTDGAVGTPTHTAPWTVYDAVVSWSVNRHWTLRLNGYNLTDKHYVAAINKSGYRYMPGSARSFLLSADFRF